MSEYGNYVDYPRGPIRALRHCFDAAAWRYGVEREILEAITVVESGMDPAARGGPNLNGTVDVGVMQINSRWFQALEPYGGEERLQNDPCFGIYVGAWILASNYASHGVSWYAVGAYNAGFSEKAAGTRRAYVEKVYPIYLERRRSTVARDD